MNTKVKLVSNFIVDNESCFFNGEEASKMSKCTVVQLSCIHADNAYGNCN